MNAATTQGSSRLSVLAINRAFASAVKGQYEKSVNRESAYEILKTRAVQAAPTAMAQNESGGGGLCSGVCSAAGDSRPGTGLNTLRHPQGGQSRFFLPPTPEKWLI